MLGCENCFIQNSEYYNAVLYLPEPGEEHSLSYNANYIIDGSQSNVEENNLNEIFVYPNPTNDILNITIPSKNYNKISIINSLGQIVYSKNIIYLQDIKIDFSNKKSGIYFIKLYSKDKIKVLKLVKG